MGQSSAFRDPVTLAVGALATYRLTRLLIEDTITAPARQEIIKRGHPWPDPENPHPNYRSGPLGWRLLADLAGCPWCMSVWIAAGWAGLAAAAPAVAAPVGAALAWSAVAGLLSSLE